jgi:hypothetical protein
MYQARGNSPHHASRSLVARTGFAQSIKSFAAAGVSR